MLAGRLLLEGSDVGEVAELVGASVSSVKRWRQAVEKGGLDVLKAKPHPGPRPRLTDEQIGELEALLRQGAKAHGWHNQLWSAQRVAQVIRRHFGVEFHVEHVRKIIRQRLHWSSQRPQKEAKQRNPEAIAL